MKKTLFGLLIVSVIALLFIMSCGDSSEIVGKVGREQVSLKELQETLPQRFRDKKMSDISLEDKKQVLLEILENRLKIIHAKELEMDKKPEYLAHMNIRRNRILASKLPDMLITYKLVSDDMIRAYSQLQATKPKVVLVSLGFQDSKYIQAPRSLDETIKLANYLYKKHKEGIELMRLAEQYSDDENNRKNSGVYDPYPPGLFDPQLDVELSKAKVNQWVGPVQTSRGVFIAQILSMNPAEDRILSQTEKERIRGQIFNKFYREEGNQRYRELTEEFKKELGWEISDEGIEQFLEAIKIWSQSPNPTDKSFTEEQRAIYLGKIGDMKITVGSLLEEFQGTFTANYQRFNNAVEMKKLLSENLLPYQVWLIKAKHQRIDKDPAVEEQLTKISESKLLELLDKYEVQEQSVPTPEEIAAYYEANKSKYVDPKKIRVWEIAVKDKKVAEKVLRKAQSNPAKFEDLAQEYTEKSHMKNRKGDLGYQNEHSPRPIIKAAFEAGENKIIGPLEENNFYLIIKTGNIQLERQKSLEEVETMVKAAVQRDKQEKRRKEINEELKKKYSFWINETLLRKMS